MTHWCARRSNKVVVVLDAGHDRGEQPLQLLSPLLAPLQYLFVIGLLLAVVVHHRQVGDEGQGEDAHAAVPRHHHLVRCAHAWRGRDGGGGTEGEVSETGTRGARR